MNVLISLTAMGIIAMFGTIFRIRALLLPLTLIGLAAALYFDVAGWNENVLLFNSMRMDNYAIAFTALAIIGAMFMITFYRHFFL